MSNMTLRELPEEYEEELENDPTHWHWDQLSYDFKLSQEFLIKHQDKLNWSDTACCQDLSDNFIRTYHNKLDWENLSYFQKLSESLIEDFIDKVDWKSISFKQILSEEFIYKHKDKIDFKGLLHSKILNTYSKDLQDLVLDATIHKVTPIKDNHWRYVCYTEYMKEQYEKYKFML